MLKVLVILFSVLFYHREASALSSIRAPHSSYKDYQARAEQGLYQKELYETPLKISRLYKPENIPQVTSWTSMVSLQKNFVKIRDEKFLVWSVMPAENRRTTWLYPDDGCYARASMVTRMAYQSLLPIPKKVFAFGDLTVKTPNSSYGSVSWWYHVASIVEVAGVKYVIDPAIDYEKPLTLLDWLSKMGDPTKMRVAVCASGTVSPKSNCAVETGGQEIWSFNVQQTFLRYEWERMKKLGRLAEL